MSDTTTDKDLAELAKKHKSVREAMEAMAQVSATACWARLEAVELRTSRDFAGVYDKIEKILKQLDVMSTSISRLNDKLDKLKHRLAEKFQEIEEHNNESD